MATTRIGTCMTCNYHGLTIRKGPNHVLHIILSLLTAGWWLIVYAIVALISTSDARFTCMACGEQTVRLGPPPMVQTADEQRARCAAALQANRENVKGSVVWIALALTVVLVAIATATATR